MNKKITILLILFIFLSSCFFYNFVYAINNEAQKDENKILSVQNNQIALGSAFNLNIDLSKIDVDKFKLVLTSNLNLGEPTSDTSSDTTTLDVSLDNNTLETIINKSDLSLNSLSLNYNLPDTVSVGDIIEFNIKIYEILDDESENLIKENSISLTVTEECSDNNGNNQDSNFSDNLVNNGQNQNFDNNFGTNGTQSTAMQNFSNNSNVSLTSSSITSLGQNSSAFAEETVTYNGSSNNYLSNLSVSGYSFTNTFSKTTLSYFVTVPNDVTSIDITATAEDTSSTVCVYGNSDLSEGVNKILVSVTSESGSVKTYRIYVTRAN